MPRDYGSIGSTKNCVDNTLERGWMESCTICKLDSLENTVAFPYKLYRMFPTWKTMRFLLVVCFCSAVAFWVAPSVQRSEGGGSWPPNNSVHRPANDTKAKSNKVLHSNVPLSTLHPVNDLGLHPIQRPLVSRPPELLANKNPNKTNYPTNAWYQNLLMVDDNEDPQTIHRTYTIPYIVDAAGPIPGLQLHGSSVDGAALQVQVNVVQEHSLTIGATTNAGTTPKRYKIQSMTPLGVTLDWQEASMRSTIAYGMAFATMEYYNVFADDYRPAVVVSKYRLNEKLLIDGRPSHLCTRNGAHAVIYHDVELSGTWMMFLSAPLRARCLVQEDGRTEIQFIDFRYARPSSTLVVRVALLHMFSTGNRLASSLPPGEVLRRYVSVYPGPQSTVDYIVNDEESTLALLFDWDVRTMPGDPHPEDDKLLTFALPHQLDTMKQGTEPDIASYCVDSLIGRCCLVEASVWEMIQPLPSVEFEASRPPVAWSVPMLAETLQKDIEYTLPVHYMNGAGDTYFSGKMIAKLARIVTIAEEMASLCVGPSTGSHEGNCTGTSLPGAEIRGRALNRLKSAVEVWLNGTAVTPFTFDMQWGGVVSCGCDLHGKKGLCRNVFPDCPGYSQPLMNFGNGFYNDMHFHYGYFIYGAAVASRFDPVWGRQMFQRVLLLIRCIANPSENDPYFTMWRHKDWFRGNSWASGIAQLYINGKNQESSSEAIAAYEAIALYGKAMESAWAATNANNTRVATAVRKLGQALVTTELSAVEYYYHKVPREVGIYPKSYQPDAVGILWQTMAQFQTWFGSAAYLVYGIQLLPLTPIAEARDSLTWIQEMYPSFAAACHSDPECETGGWSIMLNGMMAALGYPREAAQRVATLPDSVFKTSGGNGHSRSNSLWYIATRPDVAQHELFAIADLGN